MLHSNGRSIITRGVFKVKMSKSESESLQPYLDFSAESNLRLFLQPFFQIKKSDLILKTPHIHKIINSIFSHNLLLKVAM